MDISTQNEQVVQTTTRQPCQPSDIPSPSPLADPLTTMVAGYEDDYVACSPSPGGPPYSPLSPVSVYVNKKLHI